MPNDFSNNSMHSHTSSRSAAQATIGEYALATMSMYDHSSGAILSPTPRALLPHLPSYTCRHPRWAHAVAPLLSRLRLPSTSPSPFEPERPRETPCNRRLKRTRTDTVSSAVRISLFNTPDLNLHTPLILAARCRGARSLNHHNLLDLNSHLLAIQLAGTEQRPKHGDEGYVERPENAFILFQHKSYSQKNEAEAAGGVGCACKDGSTADAVITVEPLNALTFGWSVWIWSRDGPGNRHP
ncbi:uncharacterized protein FOMMEDRAFT_163791 [Fomitiporia mediterranea MF3/22]|uniref:Uncharacterized protein n=1 Tax=Fomitiporia mediterranea (strain MF3/22) TaxID=694068 RepID=R7SG17_FOMME|nr:uncharacterized protein FOMMEDRAFT_163791 [Fomitiporia mediterranea MF3/22]EJC97355.1 hypothetical protein FOMMEDRAFT_163791 [Fomitiporia mediterranea MF3/22]